MTIMFPRRFNTNCVLRCAKIYKYVVNYIIRYRQSHCRGTHNSYFIAFGSSMSYTFCTYSFVALW